MTAVSERAGRSNAPRELQCWQCREWYPEVFFERDPQKFGKNTYRRLRCIGCRLTRRTFEKGEGRRLLVKANNSVMNHARKFATMGVIQTHKELVDRFGWNVEAIAHDMEHAFKNGCPYCRRPFSEMPNGLNDLTLDIVDPSQPPYYATNTKMCCMTCNRSKAKTPPGQWALKQLCWKKWQARDTQLRRNPMIGTLFE